MHDDDMSEAERYGRNPTGLAMLRALLATRRQRPELSALEVFDLAMRPFVRTSPSVDVAFHVDGPLYELLLAAFPFDEEEARVERLTRDAPDADRGEAMEHLHDGRINRMYKRYMLHD